MYVGRMSKGAIRKELEEEPLVERDGEDSCGNCCDSAQGDAALPSTAGPPSPNTHHTSAKNKPSPHATRLKWASLALLVVQNSSLFVVTRFSRDVGPNEPLYLPGMCCSDLCTAGVSTDFYKKAPSNDTGHGARDWRALALIDRWH